MNFWQILRLHPSARTGCLCVILCCFSGEPELRLSGGLISWLFLCNNLKEQINQCDTNDTLFICQKSLTHLWTDLKSVVGIQVRHDNRKVSASSLVLNKFRVWSLQGIFISTYKTIWYIKTCAPLISRHEKWCRQKHFSLIQTRGQKVNFQQHSSTVRHQHNPETASQTPTVHHYTSTVQPTHT